MLYVLFLLLEIVWKLQPRNLVIIPIFNFENVSITLCIQGQVMDAFGTDFPTEPSALNTTEGSMVEPNSCVSEQLIEVPPPPTTPLPQPPRDVHHVHHIPPPPAIPPPQPQDLDLKELLSGFGQPSPNASASHSSSSWATPGANSVAAQLFSMPAVLDHQQMLDDLSLLAAKNYPSKTAETTPAYGVLVVLWYTGDLRNGDRWKDSHIRHFEFLCVHGCGGAYHRNHPQLYQVNESRSTFQPVNSWMLGNFTASGVVWNWDFDSLTWFCLDFSDEEARKRQVLDLFGTPEWMTSWDVQDGLLHPQRRDHGIPEQTKHERTGPRWLRRAGPGLVGSVG